jgi:hypothetical protein
MGGPSKGENMGYGQAQQNQAKTGEATGYADTNLAQFKGAAPQDTAYGKSLLQAGTSSTNRAYDNANRNMKMAMEGAGVGGSSGAVQGNNAAMAGQRAAALGEVGPSAIQGATNMQMQANQQKLQEAGMYSGAGLGYYSGANQAEQARNQAMASMWGGLLQAGTGVGEAAILA